MYIHFSSWFLFYSLSTYIYILISIHYLHPLIICICLIRMHRYNIYAHIATHTSKYNIHAHIIENTLRMSHTRDASRYTYVHHIFNQYAQPYTTYICHICRSMQRIPVFVCCLIVDTHIHLYQYSKLLTHHFLHSYLLKHTYMCIYSSFIHQ